LDKSGQRSVRALNAPVADPRLSPAEQQHESEAPVSEEWWKPEPGWTEVQYDFALMHVIGTGEDEQRIKVLNDGYAKSEHASRNDNKARWQALAEYYRLVHGKNGTIKNLKKLADDFPASSGVREQLGRALAKFGEDREAGHTFEKAADLASTADERARLLARAVQAYSEAKQPDETFRVTKRMREEVQAAPDAESRALRALVSIAKNDNDQQASIPLLERIIELRPDDREARFELAYAHSQNSNHALALLHYSKIPEHERGGATWNNVGAESDNLELPGEAVEAYRRAETENETLAMSNLATKFLKAGFLSEAKAQCERALKLEDPHRNVGFVWSQAKALPEDERKRRDVFFAKAAPISDFLRQFGRAVMRPAPESLPIIWASPEGLVTVTTKGNKFTAEGSYEQSNLFGGLFGLGGALTVGVSPPKEEYRVTYSGELNGRTVRGSVYRRREGDAEKPPTLLSTADPKPTVLMVLTDDGNELKVMEGLKGTDARFYTIRRTEVQPT
jgi:tetratricopeptide (TPR) repeat protein